MNDETSKTTPGAQEAQEMTPATMVINAAATISGKDADALTFADAIKLLIDDQTGGGDKLADVLAVITIRSADDMELNERICAAKTAEECAEILAPVINELLAQEVQIDITGRSFDPDFFRAAIDAAGGLAAIGRRAKELLTAPIKEWLKAVMQTEIKQLQELGKAAKIMYATTPPIPEESIAKVAETIEQALKSMEAYKAATQWIEEFKQDYWSKLAPETKETLELTPFIEKELEAAEPDTPFYGWTVKKFFDQALTENGTPNNNAATELLERAKKRKQIANAQAAALSPVPEESLPILFDSAFMTIYSSPPINALMQISFDDFKHDKTANTGTYIDKKTGNTFTIENYNLVQSGLSTSANKILDTAIAALAAQNFSKAEMPNPIVRFSLAEYAQANGIKIETAEQLKYFKRMIKKDLIDIRRIAWTGTITKGKAKGDYADLIFIAGSEVKSGMIEITFNFKAAQTIARSPFFQWPPALLKHDNRNPNAYVIGRKLAFHYSIDNNVAAGTNATLSVNKLLAAAPKITKFEALEEQGQRNWRTRIKKPLEHSLNENVRIDFLKKWEYRDPKTNKRFTSKEAAALQWSEYEALMIDFIVIDAPDQTERRERRAEEKAQAAIAAGKPKKKRGRPKKAKNEG